MILKPQLLKDSSLLKYPWLIYYVSEVFTECLHDWNGNSYPTSSFNNILKNYQLEKNL